MENAYFGEDRCFVVAWGFDIDLHWKAER